MTDVHSCSYYCDRPECVRAQRDELRDMMTNAKPVAYWRPKADQFCVAKPGERPFVRDWEPLYAHPPADEALLRRCLVVLENVYPHIPTCGDSDCSYPPNMAAAQCWGMIAAMRERLEGKK